MNVLYIGDIMGESGMKVVGQVLPELRRSKHVDLVIAQAENVTNGKSMSVHDMQKLQKFGVDFFTGGNHTPKLVELHDSLKDSKKPVIGPANMSESPGLGYKFCKTKQGDVLIVSIIGETFGKNKPEIKNPLKFIDKILDDNSGVNRIATIVNFHGDYSSEKRVFGYYLDGKVSAVIGDHWHVPTNDSMILPKGTAHITDVGMCGALHSSLGVKTEIIIDRWKNNTPNRNELEQNGPYQFNSVLIDVNTQTGLSNSIEQIQLITN